MRVRRRILFSRLGRWTRRLLLLVLAPACIFFVFASPAQAHPTPLDTLPQAGYSYSQSPVEIGVVFDQPVAVQRLTVSGQARGLIAVSKPLRSPDGTKNHCHSGQARWLHFLCFRRGEH